MIMKNQKNAFAGSTWRERPWREPRREAFSKECDVIKAARWDYQKAHQANFEQEGSYDLSSIFCQMAALSNVLNIEVYEVQET